MENTTSLLLNIYGNYMIITTLIVTYLLIVTFSFRSFGSIQMKELCYFEIGVILVASAVFFWEYSPDYNNYLLSYEDRNTDAHLSMEYSFIWIAKWVKAVFNDSTGVFIIYALIGVGLKLWAIKRLTDLRFLSVAVFVGFYFMLHEMIQIRAGVVSGLLLLSIPVIYERNLKLFLGIVIIACFFHYSAVLLLVVIFCQYFLFVGRKKIWNSIFVDWYQRKVVLNSIKYNHT